MESIAIKDWTVIKGKILSPRQNFYGLVIIFFDNKSNLVQNLNLVLSIYSETHDVQITIPWSQFEKSIQTMIFNGNFSQDITLSVADKLKMDSKAVMFGSELRSSINKNKTELINDQFKHTLRKILNDENTEFESAFESLTNEELAKGRISEETQATESSDDTMSVPTDYRLINAKLILAPIDGKLISNLTVGETIMVNLIPKSLAENSIIDKMKLRKPDGTAKPVAARITKIQPYGKGFQLLVNITDNYYAKIIEEEKILVKLAGTITPSGKSPTISKVNNKNNSKHSGISWMAIAAVVLLGIIIVYLAFNGS